MGPNPHPLGRQSAGRPLPLWSKGCGGGKSGLHRHTVPDNIRRGQPQGQCHRERTASSSDAARVKRCGKSAPRVRQRKRHGKPHREQNRIGTATRAVRASDNTAGRCQARCPGRLLEAMCKHGPRGMAVTYRVRKQAVPYRTRLTGWLISLSEAFSKKTRLSEDEGFGVTRRTPRHFQAMTFSSSAISVSGAVTLGEWLASIS
jgi:hypothetical protein